MTTIAPPPTPSQPLPPAMSSGARTSIRIALVSLAALMVSCSVVTLAVIAVGLSSFRVITDTHKLGQNIRSLSVDTRDVPVMVRVTTAADAAEPRVDLRMLTSARDTARRLIVDNAADGVRVGLGTTG